MPLVSRSSAHQDQYVSDLRAAYLGLRHYDPDDAFAQDPAVWDKMLRDPVIEPDSGGQGVIGLVRQLRSHGLSQRQIDEELRARGHRPRGGGHWHVQTLANISRPEAVVCAVQGEATNYKKSLAGSSSESLVASLRQGRDVRIHADRIDAVLVGHRRGRRRGRHDGEANAIGRTGAGAAPPSP